MRLLPDGLRLVRRLADDNTLPRGIRIRLALLLAYLALPFDLIPDVIPVLGYADDAIIVIAVLRGVVRHAGIDAVRAHWPGTDDGFAVLARLTGIDKQWPPATGSAVPRAWRGWPLQTRQRRTAPWSNEQRAVTPAHPSGIPHDAGCRGRRNNDGTGRARCHR